MRKLVALLLAAATLSGCVDPAHRSAYSQCIMDNPNTDAQNALMFFGAIGGILSATTDHSARDQCFLDHGLKL
jgi:hypothetical protein